MWQKSKRGLKSKMELDKKTVDRMSRAKPKAENVVFGVLNGKNEYHSFDKYKVRDNNDNLVELREIIQKQQNELELLKAQNKKLHILVKKLANDLKTYKGKVGID